MADATIAVTESTDAAAKKVDNESLVIGANTVYRQRVAVPDGADVAQGATGDAASANTLVGLLKAVKAALQGVLSVGGDVSAAAADSGKPVKAGGVYHASKPLYADGDRADLQTNYSGVLSVELWAGNVVLGAQVPDLAEGYAATTSLPIFNYGFLFNPADSKWYRQRGDSTSGQWVNIKNASIAVTGPLTDAQLRATAVPVSGTFWQATQPVSGPLTDAQLRATAVPVSGTFWQATQPVSGTVTANAGTGPFPVSDNSGSLTVDAPVGTPVASRLSDGAAFYTGAKDSTLTDGTQRGSTKLLDSAGTNAAAISAAGRVSVDASGVAVPVTDNAGSLTVDAPVGTPVAARLSDGAAFYDATKTGQLPAALVGSRLDVNNGSWFGSTAPTVGQKTMANSLPIVLASDQGAVPTTKSITGNTNVLKTGTITTTAVTADQVVLTYTVTAAKTLYLTYLVMYGRLTALSATASILGAISLETPSGTKVLTLDDVNCTTSEIGMPVIAFPEPIPIAAGVVVRVVVTPAAVTSMLWRANFGGYEK